MSLSILAHKRTKLIEMVKLQALDATGVPGDPVPGGADININLDVVFVCLAL